MIAGSHDDPSDPHDGAEVERPGPVRVPGDDPGLAGNLGGGFAGDSCASVPDVFGIGHPGDSPRGGGLPGGLEASEDPESGGWGGADGVSWPTEERGPAQGGRDRLRRAAAVLAALALVAALAAVGAWLLRAEDGSAADDGAGSPSEALSGLLAAILDADADAAGSMLAPAERAAFADAGLDLLAELGPLAALDDGSSVADYAGADVDSIGLRTTAEPLRRGMERVRFALGSLQGAVDVAALRPVAVVADWLPPSMLGLDNADPSSPVAVRLDGRWYVSVWYTLAEHVRTVGGLDLPDLSQRPPAIGAATPGDAAEAILSELLNLDARRLVGMLAPGEAAAIYDYSTLFADSADAVANSILEEREAEGWAWDPPSLEYSLAVDDDTATLAPTLLHVRGAGDTSGFELELRPQGTRLALSGLDVWGDRVAVEVTALQDGDCSVTSSEAEDPTALPAEEDGAVGADLGTGRISGRAPAPGGDAVSGATVLHRLCALQLGSSDPTRPDALVMRRVDDRWYLSPTLTSVRGSLKVVSLLGSAGMSEVIGAALAGADAPEPSSVLDLASAAAGELSDQRASSDGLDLLSPELGDPDWSYALADAADVDYEMSLWFPDVGIEAVSGVYAYFERTASSAGGTAVVVLEADDEKASAAALADLTAREGSGPAEGFGPGVLAAASTAGSPVLVAADGPLLVIVGALGAGLDAAGDLDDAVRDLLAAQLQR